MKENNEDGQRGSDNKKKAIHMTDKRERGVM